MDDEVLLLAWKDKTLLELNELVRSLCSSSARARCTAQPA